jgi:DNA-binding beta-propeller fold protein YncE
MKRSIQLCLVAAVLLSAGSFVSAQLSIAEIPYDSVPNLLKLPDDIYIGEAVGVATNSKGNMFVYTRTGGPALTLGTERAFVRGNGAARLFEFDPAGKYIREIGQGLYGFVFAHNVRVDPQDNIWVVDEGSNMVIKFDPQGRVLMTMGRKPEALAVPGGPAREGGAGRGGGEGGEGGGRAAGPPAPVGAGVRGDNFNRPTDVAWDAAGNIFVADGYGNSRVAKFDKNGKFITTWGSRGTAQSQFNTVHSIATDATGNVYVGDRGNRRIQVFDNNGTFKTQYLHVGAPWALCITPGPHQYLYSSNSNGTADMENGEIYKMELDGKIVGKFGRAGKLMKEFGSVHEIDCRKDNELLVGEITNWRVQKLMLRPPQGTN